MSALESSSHITNAMRFLATKCPCNRKAILTHIDWEHIAVHWPTIGSYILGNQISLGPLIRPNDVCVLRGNPGKTTMTATNRIPDLWSQQQEGKEPMLDTVRKTLDTAAEDDP